MDSLPCTLSRGWWRGKTGRWLAAAPLVSILLGAPSAPAGSKAARELEAERARGQEIFLTGKSPSGEPISASLGEGGPSLPPGAVTCAGCHGTDGRGRPEGGMSPSDIRWSALTRPYEVTHPSGRRHPPYNRRLLIRAITLGVDPAGNPLASLMPRFQLSKADAEALASYIEHLGLQLDPGVGEQTLRVGTLLPGGGPQEATGSAIEAVLRARFDELNAAGGMYGRKIELHVLREETRWEDRRALTPWLGETPIFALVAPLPSGRDAELEAAAEAAGLPMLGPLTQTPDTSGPSAGRAFYLLAGLEQQARALWEFAAARSPTGSWKAAIVSADTPALRSVAEAIQEQARRKGRPEPGHVLYEAGALEPAAVLPRLRGMRTLFFLGPAADAARLLAAQKPGEPVPEVMLLGPVAGALSGGPSRRVFVSFPTLPVDVTPAARERWRQFSERHRLPASQRTAQRLAFASAELLIEALRRTGREVSREGLVTTLEKLQRFQTGMTPPLTYGPGRRTGALGAYVIEVDTKTGDSVGTASWIEP